MNTTLLALHAITKIYPGKPYPVEALKGVSLDVQRGEILSLLGVNGAGKTTLSSIITTEHPPTSGDIIWRGKSLSTCLLDYRRSMGICPQKPNFDTALTVEQNLVFSGRYYGVESSELMHRVHELMKDFELTPYAHYKTAMLSGGYKQRLLIARALVHKPTLVILDEPTVALDPHIRRLIWDLILSLKTQGITVILTTHYLDEAEILSDRVCILDKGRVRLIDKPKNLMSSYNKARLEDVFLQIMQEPTEAPL